MATTTTGEVAERRRGSGEEGEGPHTPSSSPPLSPSKQQRRRSSPSVRRVLLDLQSGLASRSKCIGQIGGHLSLVQRLQVPLAHHSPWRRSPPSRLSVSPSRPREETALSTNSSLLFLSTTTLKKTHTLKRHTGCVNTCAFTNDGNGLLTGSDDMSIKLWDWRNGEQRTHMSTLHTGNVFQAIQLHRWREDAVVSCAADGNVQVTKT